MEDFAHPLTSLLFVFMLMCFQSMARGRVSALLPDEGRRNGILTVAAAMLLSISIGIGGTKGTNSPSNMLSIPMALLNTGSLTVPDWYVYRGYPQTDSDGDGIPDAWERWTRTNPNAEDALLDPDHDGVSNFEEYLYQCDPIRADTDGDGLSDRMEIDGLAAEVEDMDPLAPATYHVTEPDTNNDGIPDLWGDPTEYIVYTDWNGNGYCDDLEYDFDQLSNSVGVVFHVTSSRSCVLSTGVGYPLYLPACTNFAVRARISTDSDTKVTLYGAPDDTYVRGTWKARLEAEWEDDGLCEIENDRIRTEDGFILDMSTTCADFAGALVGDAPLRGLALLGAHSEHVEATNSTGILFWRKTISLSGTPFCSIHGPTPAITATCTGVEPPLHWEVTGTAISEDGGVVFTPAAAIGYTGDYMEIVCSKRDGHSTVILQTKVRYAPAHCKPATTNIVGACWYSTHDPEDPSDHAPGVTTTTEQFGPNCPIATNVTITAGYTHNQLVLHLRNLIRLLTGNPEDDDTDHCIGIVWSPEMNVNLWDFVDSSCYCATNQMSIRIGIASYSSAPRKKPLISDPRCYNVRLCDSTGTITYDRMWLIVCSPEAKSSFDAWHSNNITNLSWTNYLPRPTASIVATTNVFGTASAEMSPLSMYWSSGKDVKGHTYMHHNAYFEFRTEAVGIHGNQATYDISGNLITSTIAAGTSDMYAPYDAMGYANPSTDHRDHDVKPFLIALQLDGNPGKPSPGFELPLLLSRPCLYQGDNLEKYLDCRPIVY